MTESLRTTLHKTRHQFVLIFLLQLLLNVGARAEYRAFELLIVNEETAAEKRVFSNFDHIQYPQYYPLNAGERISYVRSWMCWGNTSDFRPICDPPQAAAAPPKSPESEAGDGEPDPT